MLIVKLLLLTRCNREYVFTHVRVEVSVQVFTWHESYTCLGRRCARPDRNRRRIACCILPGVGDSGVWSSQSRSAASMKKGSIRVITLFFFFFLFCFLSTFLPIARSHIYQGHFVKTLHKVSTAENCFGLNCGPFISAMPKCIRWRHLSVFTWIIFALGHQKCMWSAVPRWNVGWESFVKSSAEVTQAWGNVSEQITPNCTYLNVNMV